MRCKMDKIGVIHGRFQILHNEHMEYLLAGKSRCEYLIIGISNPDAYTTQRHATDPARSCAKNNPLTYYERFQMIATAMLGAGIPRSAFDMVPFPINYPERLSNYVPFDAKFYMTILDQWGIEKMNALKALDLDVEVMWRKNASQKKISATQVRNLIVCGKPWDHLVPQSVYDYIIDNGLDEKIAKLCSP